MPKIKCSSILFAINTLVVVLIGFSIVRFLSSTLNNYQLFTAILLPMALSGLTFYSFKVFFREKELWFSDRLETGLSNLKMELQKGHLILHGPKVAIPNQYIFWNSLLINANKEFLLCSTTNKSWFSKSREQSELIVSHFLRLLDSGGKITIMAFCDSNVQKMLETFFVSYFKPVVLDTPTRTQKKLRDCINTNFNIYLHNGCNYTANISDDRLLIIPLLNSRDFNDESIVVELNKFSNSTEYANYLADIERLKAKCSRMTIIDLIFEKDS